MLPQEWETCLDAWVSLTEVHLSFSNPDFVRISAKDESLPSFLASYFSEMALSHDGYLIGDASKSKQLRKQTYLLFYRMISMEKLPEYLLRWEVLADVCKFYGKEKGGKVTTLAWSKHSTTIEASLSSIKSSLTEELDAGLKGDLKGSEIQLRRLNHLLHVSPEAASFFMAGDDFVDALISCYKLMNPPLRKVLITTTYLCIIGLTEGPTPKFSSLVDRLYSLNAAAEAHKKGPTNVNDSLVAELVTVTPVLKQIQQKIDASGSVSNRAKSAITALQGFRKPGGSGRPPRFVKKKPNKGKGLAEADDHESSNIHVHQMSLISQIQDLFPDLGSGFVVKLLEEYNDNTEEVISHLLEGSLPPSLERADRSEELYVHSLSQTTALTILIGNFLMNHLQATLTWYLIQLLHNFLHVVTSLMMTNLINLQSMLLVCISVVVIPTKPPMMYFKIVPPLPTKPPFFLHSLLSTRMMMKETTHMILPM